MTPAIRIAGLTYTARKHFYSKPKSIVDGLNLEVAPGEICGFVGANGAGKTTTMRMLLGQLTPTQGEVRLFGIKAEAPASRRKVGFLPERAMDHTPLSPMQLLRAHGRLCGLSAKATGEQAAQALQRVGMGEQRCTSMAHFSKGMLQRVGLAQALLAEPQLLILDEPLSGLDPPGRHAVREIITEMGQRGCAVFFSTHILADVELICDRVAVLQSGKLTHVGIPHELTAQHASAPSAIEVVIDAPNPQSLALAQKLGAVSLPCKSGHRFVTKTLVDANQVAQVAIAAGATLRLFAPTGGSALESLFLPHAPTKESFDAAP